MTALTIRGGTLVSATGEERADLLVDEGQVVQVGDVSSKGHVIDASGLLVLPGMVDTHVHLMDPGQTDREDFPAGTRAAAARGVTTIVEHTHGHPIRTVTEFEEKRAHLVGRSNVDFGLAAHVWPDAIGQIGALHSVGVTFFKIFTCDTHGVPGLDSARMGEALTAVGEVGSRALIHNEDQALTADAERRLRADNRLDPALLTEWRSRRAELVAVASTAAMVLGSTAMATFAHVSNTKVLDVIDAFRGLGARIAAEACPQYFALNEDEVVDFGALRKFTPPARIRSEEERSSMWSAVADDRFSFFSTDHAPSTIAQKTETDFWNAPFGLPGLDTTLPFLIDAALTGRLRMSDVVNLYATSPAAWYRLPKGKLDVGSDADIVLIDPEGCWDVEDRSIISKAGWSPFSGRRFKGRVVATYLRGEKIAGDGRPNNLGTGRFTRPYH
ncbi:MAG TPA: dihydroorotase family protein [Acidimicrobiia bacterium]|nr:dihydroorotase family protein [Acidimicrobiia bacterium]